MMLRALLVTAALLFGGAAEAATAITINNYADGNNAVIQRISQSNQTQNVVLSGTWTSGSIPTAMDCEILIVGGGTALGITPLTSFSATGTTSGTWQGTCPSVPQGAWYNAYAQDHNNTSANATQTQQWGVGVVFWISGASNIGDMLSGAGSPSSFTKFYGPPTVSWGTPGGEALTKLLNQLQAVQGGTTPIGAIFWETNGASLGNWLPAGQDDPAHIGGFPAQSDAEFFILNVGQVNGSSTPPNPTTEYPVWLPAIQGNYQSITGRNNTTGTFQVSMSGPGGTDDLGITMVRQQQQIYSLGNAGATFGAANIDATADSLNLHYNQAYLDHQSYRMAQGIETWWGLSTLTAIGPQITSCTIPASSAVVTCALAQPVSGTGLALELGTTVAAGWCVKTSNAPCDYLPFSSDVYGGDIVVNSIAINSSTSVSLTLASIPVGTIWISYEYGNYDMRSAGNYLVGTPNNAADTLGNAVLPTGQTALQVSVQALPASGPGRFRF